MATASKREVSFVVGVETTGSAEIQRLAAEVRKLGAEGDPAAAEFRTLADQLDRLGQQTDAVTAIRGLNTEIDRLAASQVEAAAATTASRNALDAQTATVARLKAESAEAVSAVNRQVAATRAVGDSIKALNREYVGAARESQKYKDEVAKLQAAQTESRNRTDELRVARSKASAEVSKAEAAEGKLAAAYLRTREAANQADAAVRERSAALRTAETAATSLGVATTDLAQADKQLLDSQGRLIAQLGELKAQQTARLTLDQQNAAALERTTQNVRALAAAHELEQAALAESAAASAASAAAKQRLSDAIERIVVAERAAAVAIDLTNQKRQAQGTLDQQAALDALRLGEARRAAVLAAEAELAVLGNSAAATQRYAQAHRDADAAVEAFNDALKRSEQAARAADKAQEQLVASLRETEAAAERYAAAIGEAAAAGELDVAASQKRRAAAEALIASERALTAEQREAAQARDRSRVALVAEAQALLAAARAADESRAATGRLVQQALALGTAVDGTSRSIRQMGTVSEQAFGTVGIRGLQSIETEIRRVDVAMIQLGRDLRAGRISADDFARATGAATVKLQQLNAEARQVQALPGQFEKISASIQGVIARFGALGAAVATVGVAVRPVVEATIALDQMRRTLTTVTGSADEAERQIDFLRKTSQQSGQAFTESGLAYAKFAASALQSGLSIKQVQDVFKSVSLAAGNLGLSSDQAKRALEALSQMAGKGVIGMEELRQQLGDALPGVLPLLAKELGLTTQALNKVVESGNLLSQEGIPAIGRALQALQPQDGVVNGMIATWNRFINVVKEAGTRLTEGPLGGAAGVVLKNLAEGVKALAFVAVSASEGISLLGKTIGATTAFLAGGGRGFDEYKRTISEFALQSAENITKFAETARGAGTATDGLGAATGRLGKSFASLSLEQQKGLDQLQAQVSASNKLAEAAKAQGDALITLAALTGDETEAREASARAAELSVAAAEREEAATQALVIALREAKVQNEANAIAVGLNADAVKEKNVQVDAEIAKAEVSAEKARQQAEAYRATAAAVDLAGQAARNNAGSVDALQKAYEDAKTAVENTRVAMVSGAATTADLDKASRALAVAKGLLKDAINDVSEALDRQLKAMQADVKLAEAGIKLEIERQKNALAAAQLAGNEYRARQATLAIREAELRLGALSIDLKQNEARATLAAIDAEEKNLRLLGQLTPAKAADLEVRRKLALASSLEAQATQEASKAKQKEIVDLTNGTVARDKHTGSTDKGTGSTRTNTTATDGNTDALGRNNQQLSEAERRVLALTDAHRRYLALLQQTGSGVTDGSGLAGIVDERYPGVRGAGGTDNLLTANGGKDYSVLGKNDMSNTVDNSGMFALLDKYARGQIGAGDVGALQAAYDAARANTYNVANSSLGNLRTGEYAGYEAKLAAALQTAKGQAAMAKSSGGGAFGGYSTRETRAAANNKTVNVNLTLGGKTTTLSGTQSEADRLLQMIEDAQRASGT